MFLYVHGDWRTLKGDSIDCDQSITVAFDAQREASIEKAAKTPERIGIKIESPQRTFFVEELEVPAKDDEGDSDTNLEVWIVFAKDTGCA